MGWFPDSSKGSIVSEKSLEPVISGSFRYFSVVWAVLAGWLLSSRNAPRPAHPWIPAFAGMTVGAEVTVGGLRVTVGEGFRPLRRVRLCWNVLEKSPGPVISGSFRYFSVVWVVTGFALSGNTPRPAHPWIPAFAGMTEGAGVTVAGLRVTVDAQGLQMLRAFALDLDGNVCSSAHKTIVLWFVGGGKGLVSVGAGSFDCRGQSGLGNSVRAILRVSALHLAGIPPSP